VKACLLLVKIAEPNTIEISKPRNSNDPASGIIHIEYAKARVSIEGHVLDAAVVRPVLECLISVPAGARIWIAAGVTGLRRGFTGLSAVAQTVLQQEPFSGMFLCSAADGTIW
jgi:hypothetical protein